MISQYWTRGRVTPLPLSEFSLRSPDSHSLDLHKKRSADTMQVISFSTDSIPRRCTARQACRFSKATSACSSSYGAMLPSKSNRFQVLHSQIAALAVADYRSGFFGLQNLTSNADSKPVQNCTGFFSNPTVCGRPLLATITHKASEHNHALNPAAPNHCKATPPTSGPTAPPSV